MVFGLLVAGVIALAGFAVAKGADKDESEALDAANAAAAELIRSGLFEAEEGDPALALLEEDATTAEPDGELEPATSEPSPAGEPDPARGQQLFFANGCNVCHGDQGQGAIDPTIASTGFSLDQVMGQYRSPRDFMPQFSADAVPDADVADIYAWLQTLTLPDQIVPGLGTP